MIYQVNIELLSETIFGNGESKNGIVNNDVLIDKDGFPYLMGKTFKGNLRKSMIDMVNFGYENATDDVRNKLLGKSSEERVKTEEGNIRVSNFVLHKRIKEELEELKKEDRIEVLTELRYATKHEDNVAENKSLRVSRVLIPKIVFVGEIEVSNIINSTELIILEKATKSIKHLGMRRSRGKGAVSITFKKKKTANEESEFIDINNYLLYEIVLMEPAKVGNCNSNNIYEQTENYITGSAIRGAIVNKYENKSLEDSVFSELIKKVKFYDMYPLRGEKYSFPTPTIFYTTKEAKLNAKTSKNGDIEYLEEEFRITNKAVDSYYNLKLRDGKFSYYDETEKILNQFNVKKEVRFHHSTLSKKENLFRYEALASGQNFME